MKLTAHSGGVSRKPGMSDPSLGASAFDASSVEAVKNASNGSTFPSTDVAVEVAPTLGSRADGPKMKL